MRIQTSLNTKQKTTDAAKDKKRKSNDRYLSMRGHPTGPHSKNLCFNWEDVKLRMS